jgi:riboflavin synthase
VFTGIVEERGRFVDRDGERYRFAACTVLDGVALGDSIAVNGTCLGALAAGDPVNLERPVRIADRLGGHLVLGHVDFVGEIVAPAPDLRVRIPPELMRYCVEKGSIAVEGISLTIVDLDADSFAVAVIPHTAAVTTLGSKGAGAAVNVEVDVMAKHVEKLLGAYLPTGR